MPDSRLGLSETSAPLTEAQAERLERFAMDIAEGGCHIIYGDYRRGWTCCDQQDSALAAQRDGTQPEPGPTWGDTGDGAAYRDSVAAGENLCRGCRARRALEGVYVPPGNRHAV